MIKAYFINSLGQRVAVMAPPERIAELALRFERVG